LNVKIKLLYKGINNIIFDKSYINVIIYIYIYIYIHILHFWLSIFLVGLLGNKFENYECTN